MTAERIETLEKQMAALIDRYNIQETKIERMGFDIRFIRAWIAETRQEEPYMTPQSTNSD